MAIAAKHALWFAQTGLDAERMSSNFQYGSFSIGASEPPRCEGRRPVGKTSAQAGRPGFNFIHSGSEPSSGSGLRA